MNLTAEALFEKRWALTVLETSLAALQQQYQQAGKSGLFDAQVPFMAAQSDPPPCFEVAKRLEMTESAVRMAVSRMCRRHREAIRVEVGRTFDDSGDVDQEIQNLFSALGAESVEKVLREGIFALVTWEASSFPPSTSKLRTLGEDPCVRMFTASSAVRSTTPTRS